MEKVKNLDNLYFEVSKHLGEELAALYNSWIKEGAPASKIVSLISEIDLRNATHSHAFLKELTKYGFSPEEMVRAYITYSF